MKASATAPSHDAVIEAQRQVAHWAGDDGAIAHDGSLLHCSDSKNGDLRLIDDGCAGQAAAGPEVRDGEGAALHLVRLQLSATGASCKVFNYLRKVWQAAPLRMANDRHDQALVQCDGQADVASVMQKNAVRAPFGV